MRVSQGRYNNYSNRILKLSSGHWAYSVLETRSTRSRVRQQIIIPVSSPELRREYEIVGFEFKYDDQLSLVYHSILLNTI